jgi:rfaE bifunctional protein nucleotidyltransferase chain/domain
VGQVFLLDEALAWRRAEAAAGRRVACTNGLFDLLHVGHARYLQAARALADALLVGVNSDRSAGALKPGRPFVPQDERAELVAALGCVDAVVVFDDLTAETLVAALRPDVYVKGADYGPGRKPVAEAQVVAAYGGRVEFIPLVPGRSTTDLVARIRGAQQ